jgi:hypothetical protein
VVSPGAGGAKAEGAAQVDGVAVDEPVSCGSTAPTSPPDGCRPHGVLRAGWDTRRTVKGSLGRRTVANPPVLGGGAHGFGSDSGGPGAFGGTAGPVPKRPVLDGPVLGRPALEGPVLEGPALEGAALEGVALEGVALEEPALEGPEPGAGAGGAAGERRDRVQPR